VTQVNDNETVWASGAVPPAEGNTGCTENANDAPVSATSTTGNAVFGADEAAVHNASQSDEAAPQSASISTAKVPCESVVKNALPSKVWYVLIVESTVNVADVAWASKLSLSIVKVMSLPVMIVVAIISP
jgi:hypothetical protein